MDFKYPPTFAAPTAAGHAATKAYVDNALGASGGIGYRHVQAAPASVWTIDHGLGYDPAGLTVISDAGDTMDFAVVQYLDPGQSLRLSFDISLAGTAYLS
jgi:hypothetical protein